MSRLLVVVDIQKDFADGALGSPEAQAIVPHVLDRVKAYQNAGDEMVFTLDTYFDDYMDIMEGRKLPAVHCVKETSGWELIPELRGTSGTRFEKHTFGSRELVDYAAREQYDFAELVGLCTGICVTSNAILLKTAVPDTSIQVDGTCCAEMTLQSHHNALNAMGMYHIDIVQTWERPRPYHGHGCGLRVRGILNVNDKHFIITIERQYGSGGHLTGKHLAGELGIHFYGEKIFKMTSEANAIEGQYFRLADERAGSNLLHRMVTSMRPELTEPGKDDPNTTSSENLLCFQSSVIRGLAASETCIIIDRCDNYVLQGQMDNLVHTFVYADTVTRIRRVVDVGEVDEAEALRRMRRIDKERTEYHRYFTGGEQMDMENYDLLINASQADYDQMTQLIKDYLKFKGFLQKKRPGLRR